jgi:hypothetical protein
MTTMEKNNIIKCNNCSVPIEEFNEGVCDDCRFDYKAMISKTDVKKIYNLNDYELKAANLYHITFYVHRNLGTKYLIRDIKALRDTIKK